VSSQLEPTVWQGRSVFVTGVGGFVGSALAAQALARGADVTGIVRDSTGLRLLKLRGIASRLNLVQGNINDLGLVQRVLAEYEVDTVFHLAAQAIVTVANHSPLGTFESNIAGTWTVLEAARLAPAVERVVVASSDKAYGSSKALPYTEETELKGIHPYDASKVCTDVLARCYAMSFPLPVAVVRAANIYGPGDLNWSRLIPGTIRSALEGVDPVLRSDGSPERDYIFIADAVDGYLRVAAALPNYSGAAFNLGSGRSVSALDLVRQILAMVDVPRLVPRILGTAQAEISRQCLRSELARRVLGWEPVTGLGEGLATTVDWYRRYFAGIPARPVGVASI
jgi:CDP-glucose 4,6-dehydratase